MMMMIMIFSVILTWATIQAANPMKTSFLILVLVSLLLINLSTLTGTPWFPMLFMMLFAGGILMMFMILSSVLPNEKSMKMKYSKTMIGATILIMMAMNPKQSESLSEMSQAKSFLSSSLNLLMMMSVIILYFFKSMKLNGTENLSMRSLYC